MFGGTFGHESEQRDANRRPIGRRHQPLVMTNDQGNSQFESRQTQISREQHEARRCAQERAAAEGPSFLDRMSGGEDGNSPRIANKGGHAGSRRDQLNLFTGQATHEGEVGGAPNSSEHAAAATGAGRVMYGRRKANAYNESDLREIYPAKNATQLRDGESRKFEASKQSNFLNFTSNPRVRAGIVTLGSKNSKGVVRGSSSSNDPNAPQGLIDKMLGGHPDYAAEQLRKSKLARPRRPARRGSGSEFQGFPGMGTAAREERGYGHLMRKNVPSNIFQPQDETCKHDDSNDSIEQHSTRRNQRAHPQYTEDSCNLYNRAIGILPQDRAEPGPAQSRSHDNTNSESRLGFGITGLTPTMDSPESNMTRRHFNFDETHAQIEQSKPHCRTMLYQKRNESI